MQAMVERDQVRALSGAIQLDDAYWGGAEQDTSFVAAVACTRQG
jgi:hypothetical protein